jgi:hypothetical protein
VIRQQQLEFSFLVKTQLLFGCKISIVNRISGKISPKSAIDYAAGFLEMNATLSDWRYINRRRYC